MAAEEEYLKLVVIGDGGVGKTGLLSTFITRSFPSKPLPTVWDCGRDAILVDGRPIRICLWDTAGSDDYNCLRPLIYMQTDVFLVCFAVDRISTLENIEERWVDQIRHFCPDSHIVIVACKTDLRDSPHNRQGAKALVTFEQGFLVAQKLGVYYTETSALARHNVNECIVSAFRLVLGEDVDEDNQKGISYRRTFSFGRARTKKKKEKPPLPPIEPPDAIAPVIEIQTSTFAEDWCKSITNNSTDFCDVTFIFDGATRLHAHSIVLCSASEFFRRMLSTERSRDVSTVHQQGHQYWLHEHRDKQHRRHTEQHGEHQCQLNEYEEQHERDEACIGHPALESPGTPQGIKRIHQSKLPGTSQYTTIELCDHISPDTFRRILDFLYTGSLRLDDNSSYTHALEEIKRVSDIFQLPYLRTICENVEKKEDFINLSIGTYLNDETAAKMKELYLNKSTSADVVFKVDGSDIYAHKIVLVTRSDVFAAMFSGHFAESSRKDGATEIEITGSSASDFLVLLEYLYTDHLPFQETEDVLSILALADKYCLPRLVNLCELYLANEVKHAYSEHTESPSSSVVNLLHMARAYNAQQLARWCLFYISSNYSTVYDRKMSKELSEDDRKHVEENRWPPLCYLRAVKEFERKKKRKGKASCIIM